MRFSYILNTIRAVKSLGGSPAMKPICLTLTILIGGFLLAPSAQAQQFGMDQNYNQHMYQQMMGPAANSTADANTYANQTQESAWQDMDYVRGQYAPIGNYQAPIQRSQFGAISTFKGNVGQFLQGAMQSGQQLPIVRTGSMAVLGGYTGNAAGKHSSGGFSGGGGGSLLYPALPPTSTTPVQLDTAF